MKSYKHLYPKICTWENLYLAWRKARKGKRGRPPAASFEYNLEENLLTLQHELRDGSYRPGPYTSFYIHEPKRRLISAAPFRDRVVHHALCNINHDNARCTYRNHNNPDNSNNNRGFRCVAHTSAV